MTLEWYWIVALAAIIAGALASWRIITKGKINKVSAKDNSVAAGRDINIESRNSKKKP